MTGENVGEHWTKYVLDVCYDKEGCEYTVRKVAEGFVWIVAQRTSILPKTCDKPEKWQIQSESIWPMYGKETGKWGMIKVLWHVYDLMVSHK